MSGTSTVTREMTFNVTYGPTTNAEIRVRVDSDSITFGQALALAARELGVDSGANGRINGDPADASSRVKDGDKVEFTKPQGGKG